MNRLLSIIAGLLLLALLFTVSKCSDERKARQEGETNLSGLNNATLQRTKDAQGRETALKEVVRMNRESYLNLKAGDDAQIRNLQAALKAAGKQVRSATAFRAVTNVRAVGAVDSMSFRPAVVRVFGADTARLPTYYGQARAFGFTAQVKAGPDSVEVTSVVENDFTVALTDDRKHFFSKPKPVVQIKALNPLTGVTQVQSYETPQAAPKRGIWAGAGLVAGILLTLVLL